MNVTVAKKKASANVKAKMNVKVVRKPLGDLTNRPRPLQKPSKKNSVDSNVSAAVSHPKRENYDWVKEEGFLHNHDKCINHDKCMIKDILPQCSPPVKFEIRMELDDFLTPVKLVEFDIDLFAGCSCSPARPPTPGSPLLDIDPYWFTVWDDMPPFELQKDL
ncbi:uncharacterized protein LOC141657190 [Silene latifolia]|uniref:uncharacterized protein LOC141657190 n=1 Tax=Silene latifolia TaxID=37657 RepID=UPI003D776AD1